MLLIICLIEHILYAFDGELVCYFHNLVVAWQLLPALEP